MTDDAPMAFNHWMKKRITFFCAMLIATLCPAEDAKNILLIAGKPSHGRGAHEHNAGALLLKKCLDESGLPVKSTVTEEELEANLDPVKPQAHRPAMPPLPDHTADPAICAACDHASAAR